MLAQYQTVSKDMAQLRAAMLALSQQMETFTATHPQEAWKGDGTTGRSPLFGAGRNHPPPKGVRGTLASTVRKVQNAMRFMTETIFSLVKKIIAMSILLLFVYEILVLVPVIGNPSAVKTELWQQMEFVGRFAIGGWRAAMEPQEQWRQMAAPDQNQSGADAAH